MYNMILVPVDIGEEVLTQKALGQVEFLAKTTGAKVHLFHALPDASAFTTAYSFGIKAFENQAVVKAEEELKIIMAGLDIPTERLSFSVSFGTPRDEALSIADEINADLIIIGSRRPNVKTYLLGSNAAAIVRHAKVSVLVVR